MWTEGLSPAISIEQKAAGHNPRSTVGTITEIHDYLRLLYARASARRIARTMACAAGAEREPDGGRRDGLAGRHPAGRAGADRARQERQLRGRMRQPAGAGLCAPAGGRPAGNRRHGAAEEIREARHRRGDRPPAHQAREQAAPGREFRNRLATGRGPRAGAGHGQQPRTGLLQPLRLPGLQPQPAGTGAAVVQLQQPDGRLPQLRRHRTGRILRPQARGRLPRAEPGRRRDPRLGPPQRLHPLAAHQPGRAL